MRLLRAALRILRQQGWRALISRVALRVGVPLAAPSPSYARWLAADTESRHWMGLSSPDVLRLLSRDGPRISVLMPVYEPHLPWLDEAIASVQQQGYENWELCIAEDCSPSPAAREFLQQKAAQDPRIQLVLRDHNGHIAEATNSALRVATGDWVTFLDQDDLLATDALAQLVHHIRTQPDMALFYSDEDQVDAQAKPLKPFFKPDWSPHLAISQAYMGHLVAIRRSVLDFELDPQLNGSQDHDLWLRCCAKLGDAHIGHIPHVLYHWRNHAASTAASADNKPYAQDAGRQAVQRFVDQRYPQSGLRVRVGDYPLTYGLDFQQPVARCVSLIIPTKDKVDLLRTCIESIDRHTRGVSYEFIVLDNRSQEAESLRYFEFLQHSRNDVQVIRADMSFNWSRLNNLGAQHARGDVFVFLNNDTEATHAGWLEQLAGYASLPDVGVAGGLLLFPDGTIQHSGVVVGMNGWADHVFHGRQPDHYDASNPFVSPMLTRNVLAVTGACMAMTAARFAELGGFDERFEICGSDIAMCLSAHHKGYHNVLCAHSRLIHHESKTRGKTVPTVDFYMSALTYEPYRTQRIDPCFNPNLALTKTTPSLR